MTKTQAVDYVNALATLAKQYKNFDTEEVKVCDPFMGCPYGRSLQIYKGIETLADALGVQLLEEERGR